MENKLPIYKIKVDPSKKSAGVFAVSLVDQPAIEVDWIKLNKDILFFENVDQQMLYGPLLIPGKQIFRRHPETGEEFYIVFEADVIEIIARKYNKEKLTDQFNIMHSDKKVEAYLAENWIVKEPDASQAYGFNLPTGTWFGGVKVEDEKFWKSEVRTEMVKGFSVEIRADLELMNFSTQNLQSYTDYPQAARDNAQRALDWKEKNGSDCGTLVGWTRARQLANGEPISEDTINRMSSFQRHAQYKDVPYDEGCGGIMWDAWGGDAGIAWAEKKAAELRELSSESEDKYNEQKQIKLMTIKTNEGVDLYFDGELAEGTVVFVDEAMTQFAPEGAHMLEDGRVITLDAEGVVLSIAEETPDIDAEKEKKDEQKLALDPAEVMTAIQPALDEFRSLIAELMSRVDVLEQHEAEYPDAEEFKKEVEDIKSQVEKLASSAGAPSIVSKTDAKAKPKSDNQLLEKFSRISKFR